MRALVVNNHSLHIEHVGEIQALLNSLGYSDCVQVPREELYGYDAGLFDVIFLSGVSGVAAFPVMGHEVELAPEFDLIRSWNKPLIGVCYGCQILARAFGAEMAPLEEPLTQELVTIRMVEEGRELIKLDSLEYTVYSSRKNYIASVPDDFIVVAESHYGPEIIVHKSKPYIGVMFHPEHIVDGNQGVELVREMFRVVMNR